MKSCLGILVLAVTLATSSVSQAENWVFMRSYYSHDPVSNVRIGRQYSTGPVFTRPQGFYVKSGFRNDRSTTFNQGGTYDTLNIWESWIQTGAKY
jgi:hypothetical protein